MARAISNSIHSSAPSPVLLPFANQGRSEPDRKTGLEAGPISLSEILDQVDAGQLSLAKLIGQYSDRGGVLSRQRERQTLQAPTSPVASAVFNFGTIISEQDAPRRSD